MVITESLQQSNLVEFVLLGIGINANCSSYKFRCENIKARTMSQYVVGIAVNEEPVPVNAAVFVEY